MGTADDNWYLTSMGGVVVYNPSTDLFTGILMDDSDTCKRLRASVRVEKLLKRKTITIQEGDSIKAMIDSTDVESLELAIALIEEKEKIKTWNEKLIFWKR